MTTQCHWKSVHHSKTASKIGLYRVHTATSFALIRQSAFDQNASIIDSGGGRSTLIDDLIELGYTDSTALDISAPDRKDVSLTAQRYEVWHDRTVSDFLADAARRTACAPQVRRAVKPGGFVILATVGPEGLVQSSGLWVLRSGCDTLHGESGPDCELLYSRVEHHKTRSGVGQQFVDCYCKPTGAAWRHDGTGSGVSMHMNAQLTLGASIVPIAQRETCWRPLSPSRPTSLTDRRKR